MTNIVSSLIRLCHITDVGSPHGDGSDSTHRIERQYHHLGHEVRVISAGHSPLHVAFTGSTCLHKNTKEAVEKTRNILQKTALMLPVALNSAPRNSHDSHEDGKEDFIYRIIFENEPPVLLYGPDVLRWILTFYGREKAQVEMIVALGREGNIVQNTSNGSQFRSAEHLPVAHVLQAHHLLDENSERVVVDHFSFPDLSPKKNTIITLPSDEYGNGRVLLNSETLALLLEKKEISIPGISQVPLLVKNSITKVVPGEISVWPSSNHFPNPDLHVVNVGTRWSPGTTKATDRSAIELATFLSKGVGNIYPIE